MSLPKTPLGDAAGAAPAGTSLGVDFRFIPKYLAIKCQQLIESYHAVHGYACLPDMLWGSVVRDLIESDKELRQIFRRASRTKSAKKANEGFVLIASAILSIEVMASDFAGWGSRFPWAKRKAEAFLREHPPDSRARLMELYLPPHHYIDPNVINALVPPERS